MGGRGEGGALVVDEEEEELGPLLQLGVNRVQVDHRLFVRLHQGVHLL